MDILNSHIRAESARRISCGGRYICVQSRNYDIYEIKEKRLEWNSKSADNSLAKTMDISATIWEDIFIAHHYADSCFLGKYQGGDNMKYSLQWHAVVETKVDSCKEARVSTRDGKTVIFTHGKTIKVFQI